MNKFFCLALLICLSSCSSYYQFFEVRSASPQTVIGPQDIYVQDGKLEVRMNLWSAGGSTNLTLNNTSDQYLYVDVPHTHLLVDGVATSYYFFTAQTHSVSQGYARSTSYTLGGLGNRYYRSFSALSFGGTRFNGTSNATTVELPKKLILPPHSSKMLEGFGLVSGPLDYCSNRDIRRGLSDSSATIKDVQPFSNIQVLVAYSETEAGDLRLCHADLAFARFGVASQMRFWKSVQTRPCSLTGYDQYSPISPYGKPNRFYVKEQPK